MTYLIQAVVVGPVRNKHLGKVGKTEVVTPKRFTACLVYDDEMGDYIVTTCPLGLDQSQYPKISKGKAQELIDGELCRKGNSVSAVGKMGRTKRYYSIEEKWKRNGANGQKIPKPDRSFLLGKSPSKIAGGRKSANICRSAQTRTGGLLVPNEARYQLRHTPILRSIISCKVKIVPKVGIEPTRDFSHTLLRRACLPFHHFGFGLLYLMCPLT